MKAGIVKNQDMVVEDSENDDYKELNDSGDESEFIEEIFKLKKKIQTYKTFAGLSDNERNML